jgi:beta-glucosidase
MRHIKILYGIVVLTFFTLLSTAPSWKWQDIFIGTLEFPESFEWGVTTLSYETEGYAKTSTWYAWESQTGLQGKPFTRSRPERNTGHLNNYKEDVQLLKTMGISTYCFSLDWSRIEPEQGYFDEEVIQQYIDLCNELMINEITVTIILKDYCDPLWWGYMGGFEYEKNNALFERYCLKMYSALGRYADRWITFWAPENYALLGYFLGNTPPGIRSLNRAANVLKNELEAHVRVYNAIKAAPHGNKTRIGIIKHVHTLEPWYVWDRVICSVINMFTNKCFYSFFTNGTFSLKIPIPGRMAAWITHSNPSAPKSLDFIGVNYYSHSYIKNIFNHISNPHETPTDIPGMTMYPEGLYCAIKEVSERVAKRLNIPIIITQNGIATRDESLRDLFIKRHLFALYKAKTDGHNVEGYYYYSFLDGFAWGSYDNKFGLVSIDRNTKQRTIKDGSQFYRATVQK